MSAIRYVETGVQCDHEGCTEMLYASQLGDGEGVKAVRARLRERGWKTGVGNPRRDSCPAHVADADGES